MKYVQLLVDANLNNLIDGYKIINNLESLANEDNNSIDKMLIYGFFNYVTKEELPNVFSLICSKIRKGGYLEFNMVTLDSILSIDGRFDNPKGFELEINKLIPNIKNLPRYSDILKLISDNNMILDTSYKVGYLKNEFSITR
jgi:hypothetical protein